MESYKKLATQIKNNNWFVENVRVGIEKLKTENFAFITESTAMHQANPKDICEIKQIGTPLVTVFYGIGLQKSKCKSIKRSCKKI